MAEDDPALHLLRRLQSYVIYAPTTRVLSGVALEQPRHPLGLSGGGLPEAVDELINRVKQKKPPFKHIEVVFNGVTPLIGWARSFAVGKASELLLSPAAQTTAKVIAFEDRFMAEGRNVLSGYDASEGALYVLFLAVLAAHPQAPSIMAIDNADHGLNPGLAKPVENLTGCRGRHRLCGPQGVDRSDLGG